jgi:hypothetical protein
MHFIELDGVQRRQLIDTQQAFAAWQVAHRDHVHRFAGSMRWVSRNGGDYLLRKIGRTETSLGRRGVETEAAYQAFQSGRDVNSARLKGLSAQIDKLAPINRAMGLGRVPATAARVLRVMDEHGLLGTRLFVVGTNAIYAYEAVAGVQFATALTASGDIDLLLDARRRISLAFQDHRKRGLIGLLKKADPSFTAEGRSFRAFNKEGYRVDLIRPEPKNVFRSKLPVGISDLAEDLEGAPIFGLDWLINAPKFEAVALDVRGYPVRLVAADPRAFALHKAWISSKPDREPIKAKRDMAQARASAQLATRYLNLRFEEPDLMSLPMVLMDQRDQLEEEAVGSLPSETPNW